MIAQFIPQIWTDAINASLQRGLILGFEYFEQELAQHKERMANDPDYARAYELREAEDEAMSYWDALYDNQLPESDEEDY